MTQLSRRQATALAVHSSFSSTLTRQVIISRPATQQRPLCSSSWIYLQKLVRGVKSCRVVASAHAQLAFEPLGSPYMGCLSVIIADTCWHPARLHGSSSPARLCVFHPCPSWNIALLIGKFSRKVYITERSAEKVC